MITGSASGIGADLHDANVIADLATDQDRGNLVDDVKRISSGSIDGSCVVTPRGASGLGASEGKATGHLANG